MEEKFNKGALQNLPSKDLLTNEEIAELIPIAEEIEAWAKDIKAAALERLIKGEKISGYKVVEGKSNRCWKDEQAVVEALEVEGYDDSIIYEKKLKGLSAIESLVGKRNFNDLLGHLVVKPAGKPTLAPDSDKRPSYDAIIQAASDFDD